ncbi:MAG: prepilin-type N-terminal cleavage/methylation domain-containing protein [bacterium]
MLFTCKNNIYKNKKIKNILKGFTLVEMLVVIAIIIIIIGAGFGMLSSRKNYEYKAEVDKIYKFITDAQANATKSSPVITVTNPSTNPRVVDIGFRLPNNITGVTQNYIALFRINKILNNNANVPDSLNLEYFEKIRREIVISNSTPQGAIQQTMINSIPFNLPTFYDQNLFLNNNNYPISYIVLIRNNSQFLPIVFRTDGSLAATRELYVQIRYLNNNRFRTYFIGINGKNVRKYVR